MSDELIVDPAAVAAFAAQLADHVSAVRTVRTGLQGIGSGAAGALFGDFEGATEINQRSQELLTEMVKRLAVVSSSLDNLQAAAAAASSAYHASDHLSEDSIATINSSLDAFDKTAATAPGSQL